MNKDLIDDIKRTMNKSNKVKLILPDVVRSFKIQGNKDGWDWEKIVLAENKDEALSKIKKHSKDSTDIKLVRDYGKPLF